MNINIKNFFERHDPQAVFFDYDGTLVNSLPFLVRCHNYAHKELGLGSITELEFQAYFGLPRDYLYKDIYGDKTSEALTLFEEYYTQNHLKTIHLLEGASELIEYLCSHDIPVGIVSNKKGDFLRAEVDELGWSEKLSAVLGAKDTAEDKPSALPLTTAIQNSIPHLNPNQVLYVGDTHIDHQCAEAAGCPLAYVGHEFEKLNLTQNNQSQVMQFDSLHHFYTEIMVFHSKKVQ